jgi:hypothetical protein
MKKAIIIVVCLAGIFWAKMALTEGFSPSAPYWSEVPPELSPVGYYDRYAKKLLRLNFLGEKISVDSIKAYGIFQYHKGRDRNQKKSNDSEVREIEPFFQDGHWHLMIEPKKIATVDVRSEILANGRIFYCQTRFTLYPIISATPKDEISHSPPDFPYMEIIGVKGRFFSPQQGIPLSFKIENVKWIDESIDAKIFAFEKDLPPREFIAKLGSFDIAFPEDPVLKNKGPAATKEIVLYSDLKSAALTFSFQARRKQTPKSDHGKAFGIMAMTIGVGAGATVIYRKKRSLG